MPYTHNGSPVHCWEQQIVLPTYLPQQPDPNPMFLEKRVYQGSRGKVYPNPFTDRVALEKVDASYRAIYLENEFIQLMILPEIGGRIHAGLDKTNQYDFFYRQNVIKPALVGLLGPWISGGVEFNWPQHHRPSTFMPTHALIEKADDGSRTVWLSEHEPMERMKGMVGICLRPGRAVVEAKVRLYNRTPLAQTFLWWANVAVRVHDQYQAFFPPDVTFVADHAKRAVSSYPVARNEYYGVDYRPGTDISWYKNIPVPTSYMVMKSRYDFCGGYDHARQAGVVHTSNHHIAPGKKMWTWGNAEFGYAWERNLTDEDGPYIELMAGAYTDNQPDFSWLQPYETKSFSQFWYPIQQIGPAKNANTEAAVNLEFDEQGTHLGVCVTTRRQVRVVLTCRGQVIAEVRSELEPGRPLLRLLEAANEPPHEYRLAVEDADGNELIAYRLEPRQEGELPAPAAEPPLPAEVGSVEELYLIGLHLQQYRHATRSPESYWQEGLRRDPEDSRINNAIGLARLRDGQFAVAERHFAAAIRRLTARNPNPCDGEPYYNLGRVLYLQGRNEEAYEAFHKAVWNYAWQSPGYYALACISAGHGHFQLALEQVEQSLVTNVQHLQAHALRVSLLRRMERREEALVRLDAALALDPLDFRLRAELFLLNNQELELNGFLEALEGDGQTLLDVVFDLAWSGLKDDAMQLLQAVLNASPLEHPMLWYTLGWLAASLGQEQLAAEAGTRAEAASPLYCFPARIEEMIVLEDTLRRQPASAKALTYLGNLYYDKRRYQAAIDHWRRSVALDGSYSIPWRNLGIAEFNILRDAVAADRMYARAFAASPADARLLYEWDHLKKRACLATAQERLAVLNAHRDLVAHRDDLSVEHITLLNQTGKWLEALKEIANRRFSPWEGGEGLVSAQYVHAHRALGVAAFSSGQAHDALQHFEAARNYPKNLGEGKHLLTLERDLDYLSGCAVQHLGVASRAIQFWQNAAAPLPAVGAQSYFQALGAIALGEVERGQKILHDLAEFAEGQKNRTVRIDYFATSLPNMLLFEDDLQQRNRVESLLLSGLAAYGLNEIAQAEECLREVIALDSNHLFALWLSQEIAAGNWQKLQAEEEGTKL
jgi:tetratricopeptide (TPR) repeat protein